MQSGGLQHGVTQHTPAPFPLTQVTMGSSAHHAHLVPVQEVEAQDMLQLPQADGAEVQGPPQDLIQAERPLQEAAQPAAVPQAQQVAELMAGDLERDTPPCLGLPPVTLETSREPTRSPTPRVRLDCGKWSRCPSWMAQRG